VPAETRLEALEGIRTRLEPLDPTPSPQVTKEIVDAALEVQLGTWIRFDDLMAVCAEVSENMLSWEIQRSSEASRWQGAAVRAAGAAMVDLLTRDIRAEVGLHRALPSGPRRMAAAQCAQGGTGRKRQGGFGLVAGGDAGQRSGKPAPPALTGAEPRTRVLTLRRPGGQ